MFIDRRLIPHFHLQISEVTSLRRQYSCCFQRQHDLQEVDTHRVKAQTINFNCRSIGFCVSLFQGSRVTSDGGLILVRELDERLGFGEGLRGRGSASIK